MVRKSKSTATAKLTHFLVQGAGWIPVVRVIDDGEPQDDKDYLPARHLRFETDNSQVIVVEREAIIARKYKGNPT